jgi:hypothetical protein
MKFSNDVQERHPMLIVTSVATTAATVAYTPSTHRISNSNRRHRWKQVYQIAFLQLHELVDAHVFAHVVVVREYAFAVY